MLQEKIKTFLFKPYIYWIYKGAPAIAITGVLSVAVELNRRDFQSISEISKFTIENY